MNNPCIVPANSRGGIVLLHNNYRYVRNWRSASKQIWRCTQTGCRAYLHTNVFDFTDNNAQINGRLTLFALTGTLAILSRWRYLTSG